MPLTDADYNSFAAALVANFARRVKGLDEDSARLVGIRASDHILTGFLTPASAGASTKPSRSPSDVEDIEALLTEDLPRDSAYEQTAMGMEWIAPISALRAGAVASVEMQVSVYVRRLPTFHEQRDNAVWRIPRQVRQVGERTSAAATVIVGSPPAESLEVSREANLVSVWTRELLPPLRADLDLSELLRLRQLATDLSPQVSSAWASIETSDIYPGRHLLSVDKANLTSPEVYAAYLATLPSGQIPLAWRPIVDVRIVAMPTRPGHVRVALRLVNRTDQLSSASLDYADPNLYGLHMAVTIPANAHAPTVFRELPESFRYDREMPGVGINAHLNAKYDDKTLVLEVDSVPCKEVGRLEPREIDAATPRFDLLATDPIPILLRILAEMRTYDVQEWQRRIAELNGVEVEEAVRARERFQDEITRFERGIDLIADERYPAVQRAFGLMNQAMVLAGRQRISCWRLFQIVFIVSQLPTLASREYPELRRDDDDKIDILWFAAGGGKTEAFLGLIIWQAFFDRLRGKNVGVAAFVRFPLRLLTFQQLQRLGQALACAELIRERENLSGSRFSMGYFVGSAVTPNSIDDKTHQRYISRGIDQRVQRVFQCPFCLSDVKLRYLAELRLVEHVCTNQGCPGGSRRLPVYIVDNDVYRFLPTVVVSTVDKLAQLGQNQRFANIFGRFDLVCHRHGASFLGLNRVPNCEAAQSFCRGERVARCGEALVSYGPFHDPSPALLVQDELHLLSEELGTFDAHYETGAMQMMRSVGAIPWKVVAATATIEEYEQHVWHLYLRGARQFPGPGPAAYESFYYHMNPQRTGRIFVGVLGVGRKHTPAVTRTLSLLYLELQAARDLAKLDLGAACARYGTSLLTEDEFRWLVFLYELQLTYVLTRKGSDQVAEAIESRVKKELRELAPQGGELLVDMFNGGVDVAQMIAALEEIRSADPSGDPAKRIRGLVTTNIIGHGVDVDRFNIIVFAGFTRLVAEYIQASARVGRAYPGISIFVATPQSERDRTIFDRFAKFHEYLDRLVDPSAVTRWPEPALQRTVPGLLAGYVMGVAAQRVGVPIPTVEKVQDLYGRQGTEALNEEQILQWMDEAYGVCQAPSPRYRDRLAINVRNKYASIVNRPRRSGGKPNPLNTYLGAMRSLRDVDDPAYIRVENPRDQDILRELVNG